MRLFPETRRAGLTAHPCGDDTLIITPEGAAHRLDAASAAVWRAADGTRSLDALLDRARAAQPQADRTLLFEILDHLTDAGLLETRLGPPAAMSRRVLVQRLAGASAAAALGIVVGAPRPAAAKGCEARETVVATLKRLVDEQDAIGTELETMVRAEMDAEAPKPKQLEALSAREAEVKGESAKLTEMRQLAELDDTECREPLEGAAHLARRKKAFAQRQEKDTKRQVSRRKMLQKRMRAASAREKQVKRKLAAREKEEKAGASREAQHKSRARHQEEHAKVKQRHALRRKAREQHHKQQSSHSEALRKQRVKRYAAAKKQPAEPLVSQEEATKAKAADQARAKKVKEAGSVKAHARRVAKEQHLKARKAHHESATKRTKSKR